MKKPKKNYELINRGEIGVVIKKYYGISSYYPYNPIYEWLEVNCHFNHSTLKIDTFRDEQEEWTYRLMRDENDPLANWQGRNQAINIIGEDCIIEAENQVRKNIRLIRKDIKNAKLNPIWLALKFIADKTIENYKVDFYYSDCLWLYRKNPSKFLWLVRKSGTWLIYQQSTFADVILEEELNREKYGKSEHDIYFWKNGKMDYIPTFEEALKLYHNEFPKMEVS